MSTREDQGFGIVFVIASCRVPVLRSGFDKNPEEPSWNMHGTTLEQSLRALVELSWNSRETLVEHHADQGGLLASSRPPLESIMF
jgi:hypothetical protein